MVNLSKVLRKNLGKKWGKFFTTSLGMLVLWLVMGIWHGAFKYIIGVSLWYWIVLMLGELIAPASEKLCTRLGFKTDTFGWHLFQSARTYLIYAIGAVFFRGNDISQGGHFIYEVLTTITKERWNPWILFDGSILELGLTYIDFNIVIISVAFMVFVAILRENYGYARNWIDRQPVLFRWALYIGMLLFVIIFGKYGPDYIASNFIYGDF